MMRRSYKKGRWLQRVLFIFVLLLSGIWVAPLVTTVIESFVPVGGVSPYEHLLVRTPIYLKLFWNSVLITLTVVCGSIVVSLLGAYGFTVLRFKGKETLFFLYLVVMLLPLQVTLMPNYMVAGFLGIQDTYLAIILPAIFNPFGVFLLRQQMKLLPEECVEAAKIDGAGHVQIFFHITLPMVKSGIAAVIMLLAVEYWNLIDQAVVFIRKAERYPLSIFLARVNEEAGGLSGAAAVFYMTPVLALLLYGHEYLKEGIGLIGMKDR